MNKKTGFSSRSLKVNEVVVEYLDEAGPRIVGLRYRDSANLLARAPEIAIPTQYGDYYHIGGHRLWFAPEGMPRSYIPDSEGLRVTDMPNGVLLEGKRQAGTGIRKCLEIRIDPERAVVTLTHTLVNESLWEVELAPWAITMMQLGGVAILPFQAEQVDMEALLPNRHISLWAYSKINDPRLQFGDDFIVVSGRHKLPMFKIGTFNPRGWMAYWNQGVLFRKTFEVHGAGSHPDFGCNAEIYCDEHFLELESLAPLGKLAVGESVSHIEQWELFDSLEQDFLSGKALEWLR